MLKYIPPAEWTPSLNGARVSTEEARVYFTVLLNSHQIWTAAPPSKTKIEGGRKSFPAVYYCIQVEWFHSTGGQVQAQVVWRRFSQFKWLYEEFSKSATPKAAGAIALPASRPFSAYRMSLEDERQFVLKRQDELSKFCVELLGSEFMPQAVLDFFELHAFQSIQPEDSLVAPSPPVSMPQEPFPFDVIVVTSPDNSAARAALAGTLQDVVKLLNNLYKSSSTSAFGSPKRSSATNSFEAPDLRRQYSMDASSSLGGSSDWNDDLDEESEFLLSKSGILVLSTSDPFGARCGSGGGTLAALAYADAVYSKCKLHRRHNHPDEYQPSVLIIHAGGDSSRCPTQMALGKAWTSLPVYHPSPDPDELGQVEISSPTLMILRLVQRIFLNLPEGSVVVTAGDCLISLGEQVPPMSLESDQGVVLGLAVPAPLTTAKNHGVFFVPPGEAQNGVQASPVAQFLQKPSVEILQCKVEEFEQSSSNVAWIDTGVVVFLPKAAQCLRALGSVNAHQTQAQGIEPVLKACTRAGLEELYQEYLDKEDDDELLDLRSFGKNHALPIDLYSHIMLALPTLRSANQDLYVNNLKKSLRGIVSQEDEIHILSTLYHVLSKLQFQVLTCPKGQFLHLGTTRELLDMQVLGVCNAATVSKDVLEKLSEPQKQRFEDTWTKCRDFGQSCHLVSRSNSFLSESVVEFGESSVAVNTYFERVGQCTVTAPLCVVGSSTVMEHCHVRVSHNQTLTVGNHCLLSGLRGILQSSRPMKLCDGTMIQTTKLKPTWCSLLDMGVGDGSFAKPNDYVVCVLHVDDNIKSCKQVYGMDMSRFLQLTQLSEQDLWSSDLPVAQRNLWNAQLHPIVTLEDGIESKFDFDLVVGWISQIMSSDISNSSDSEENTQEMISPLLDKWKQTPRLTLQQIRAVSDAFGEYSARHELENLIAATFEKHLSKIGFTIKHRVNAPCDTTPFIECFIGGDPAPLRKLWHRLEKVINSSAAKEKYDCSARCFMVMAALLSDLSEKLAKLSNQIPNSDQSTAIPTLVQNRLDLEIETIRSAPYQRSVMPFRNSVQGACIGLTTSIHKLLKPCMRWAPSQHTWHEVLEQRVTLEACAGFLERAAASLTEVCVSSSEVVLRRIAPALAPQTWAVASAPGRIDLAGGWSDTPPISYEHGGSVLGVSVVVDGVKPISARCRRIAGWTGVRLITEARRATDGSLINIDQAEIHTLRDLADYRDPKATACLLKAALICIGLVPRLYVLRDVNEEHLLDEPIQPFVDAFFQTSDGCGVELVATSLLPKGSGMGGSSLLGGCVLAAISQCAGVQIVRESESEDTRTQHDPKESLIYAVLILEQLMTTGGGWQDQTNLIGGFKIARTPANIIPLDLKIEPLSGVPKEVIDDFNDRLVLVYTGTPRLAKNLLLQVLRRWARRTDEIRANMDALVQGAEQAASAIASSADIDQLAACMSQYRTQKKIMIGSFDAAEPPHVSQMMDLLFDAKLISGGTILGAGGGGYLALVASKGLAGMDLKPLAMEMCGDSIGECTWHQCCTCDEGLRVFVSNQEEFHLEWHKVNHD